MFLDIEVIMPNIGEGILEVTIIDWIKKEGDFVLEYDLILEVSTDKIDIKIPSLYDGIIKKKKTSKNQVIKIGSVLGVMTIIKNKFIKSNKKINFPTLIDDRKNIFYNKFYNNKYKNFYSPLVRSIIYKEKITQKELKLIYKNGKYLRLTKNDILKYINKKKKINKIPFYISSLDKITEISFFRKKIAKKMIYSKRISSHVTSFIEADITNIYKWRKKYKKLFIKKLGHNIGYTSIFIKIISKVIKNFPIINSYVYNNKIIKKKNINIGIAVSLKNGNLVVPVIKNVDKMDLIEIAVKIKDMIHKAYLNNLTFKDISDATYTISNIGTFKNLMGTPIITQPQVAILAFGEIITKPSIVKNLKGNLIKARQKIFFSHSYDHRIIDGYLGGGFLKNLVKYLELFDLNKNIF